MQLTTVLCLGVFPSPSAGGVSAYKKVIDFFRSKRWCITLEHIVQLFCCLGKSSDCRSDISEGTWIHCQRKVHPSLPPFSILRRRYTGVGSEPVYPTLRNVLLYSPGSDASVLQRDLDVPLGFGSFSRTVLPAVHRVSLPGKPRCLTQCRGSCATTLVPGT